MTRRLSIALALVATLAAPLRADLKYTAHSELKPATVTDSQPANPMLTMLGGQITQQMLPNGSADTVYIVTEKGMRTEYIKGGMNQQAEGTVLLAMTNGDLIQLNTKDKTYWRSTTQALTNVVQSAGIQLDVKVTPTSEATTIAGVRATRSNFEINIPLPIPEQMRAQLPPGVPTGFSLSGEVWYAASTPAFERYTVVASRMGQALAGMGLGKLLQGGIVMRQVMRSQVFNGQQLETEVTKIGEEAAPADAFDIPADYKEVPSPIK